MDHFNNSDLEFVGDDYYYDFEDEDDKPFFETQQPPCSDLHEADSDFESDFETDKAKTDTSAWEARNGKDIQGIPWERLNYTRDKYREKRLKLYKNYESLSRSREELDKDCLQVEMGKKFYDFQFNTRLVKSTIVHFQNSISHSLFHPKKRRGCCLLAAVALRKQLVYGMIGKFEDLRGPLCSICLPWRAT